jgi:hypothetical protein
VQYSTSLVLTVTLVLDLEYKIPFEIMRIDYDPSQDDLDSIYNTNVE